MSEKKAKSGKPSFFSRVWARLKRVPFTVANAFKNMWAELKKVSWPSRKDLINYSIIVIAFMLFMAVVVGLLDVGASQIVRMLVAA